MRTLVFLICLLLKPLVHGDVFDFEQPGPSRIPMSLHHKATGTYGLVNQGKQPSLNSLAKNYGGSESNAFFKPMMSKDTLNNQIGGSQLGSVSEQQTFNQIGSKQVSQSFNKTKVAQKSDVGDLYKFQSQSGNINNTPITWTSSTGTGQTYKVWQRTDIDWNQIRANPGGAKKFIGKTNAEAALAKLAPELPDGSLATLHHINQNGLGNLVEASTRYHGFGKDYKTLHNIWGKNKSHPTNPVNRPKFDQDKGAYWKERFENQ